MSDESRFLRSSAPPLEQERVKKPYEAEGSPEMEQAKKYWRERLQGETRIERPMHSDCQMGIVVPVYGEDRDRLRKQRASLRNQRKIRPTQFEITYVVNNGPDTGSEKWLDVRAQNALVMADLQQDDGLIVHVIDKTSPGNTIPDCNVGRARNRGVAEAGVRFYEQGKNGLLLQTDADTWLEDPEHLRKALDLFEQDPEIIGASGGLLFEWDPDTQDPARRADLRSKLERFFRLRQYKDLRDFLTKSDVIRYAHGTRFSGANVMSRSLESAMVGGVVDTPRSGSSNFGLKLEDFAQSHGQKVVGKRRELIATTALRESDRTASSFKYLFDRVDRDLDQRVRNDVPDESLPLFRKKFYGQFRLAFEAHDRAALRALITLGSGEMLLEEKVFQQIMDGKRGNTKHFRDMLTEFNKAYTGKKTLLERLYEEKSSSFVELTPAYLEKLREEVRARPDGEDFIDRMDTYYRDIRIKE